MTLECTYYYTDSPVETNDQPASIFTRAERALAWLPRESAALAGDYQACMGPQGERYQEEERQRSREAATWTHRVCQASVTVKSILAPGRGIDTYRAGSVGGCGAEGDGEALSTCPEAKRRPSTMLVGSRSKVTRRRGRESGCTLARRKRCGKPNVQCKKNGRATAIHSSGPLWR